MTSTRKLALRRVATTELGPDELREVAGAEATLATCALALGCRVSDMAASLCGCLTGYCSIDVC